MNAVRDLRWSVALIGGVVFLALIGLATDGNWPKILRVSLAFAAYATVLLGLAAYRKNSSSIPFAWFAAAGVSAGVVSGLVRPEIDAGVLIAGSIAAGLLIAGVHCLAIRKWRALQEAIK